MKRKLESKYKKLVKYINERRLSTYLAEIITNFEYADGDLTSKEMEVLNSVGLNADTHSSDFDKLIQIIVNIYNNNYELEEPKYYWKFKELRGLARYDLYFGITFDDEPLLVDISDCGTAEQCTKSELNNYLRGTELTADNFIPVEEQEND